MTIPPSARPGRSRRSATPASPWQLVLLAGLLFSPAMAGAAAPADVGDAPLLSGPSMPAPIPSRGADDETVHRWLGRGAERSPESKLSPRLRRALADRSLGARVVVALVSAERLAGAALGPFHHQFRWPAGEEVALVRTRAADVPRLAALQGVAEVDLAEAEHRQGSGKTHKPNPPTEPDASTRSRGSGGSGRIAELVGRRASPATASGDGRASADSLDHPDGWWDIAAGHDAAEAWRLGYRGQGVKVAVMDSGVDFGHADLQGTWAMLAADSAGAGWPQVFDPSATLQYVNDTKLRISPPASALANGSLVAITQEDMPKLRDGDLTACFKPLVADRNSVFEAAKAVCDFRVPTNAKGALRFGHMPDWRLSVTSSDPDADEEVPGVLLMASTQAGTYDTVIVDIDGDHDFTNEPRGTQGHPLMARDADEPPDGIADVSGGLLYYIADGERPLPGSYLLGLTTADTPKAGTLVGILVDTDGHGTACASAIASQGRLGVPPSAEDAMRFRNLPRPGLPKAVNPGMAPAATIVAVGDVYSGGDLGYELAWRYAALGDDPTKTSDDLGITSNSYGWSEAADDGWDLSSRLVDHYVRRFNPSALFFFATGNGGPGYGTITPPSPAVGIDVAASTQYGAAERHSITDTTQITFGDITPFSNRGPGAFGQTGPDVAADGAYGWGAVPLNSLYDPLEFAISEGFGAEANEPWAGTSRSAPVTAGAMALVEQAFKAKHGRKPRWDEAKSLIMGGARFNGYDTWTTGAGVLDAADSVRLAAGLDGLYAAPSEWSAGDYQGQAYTAFPNFVSPGQQAAGRIAITNPSPRAVQAAVKAETLRLIKSSDATLTLDPSKESAQSKLFPSYVVKLDRHQVPANTDLMVVRAVLPLDQADTDGDDDPILNEVMNIGVLQHTDIDQDGQLFHDDNKNGAVNYATDADVEIDWPKSELDRWEFELLAQHFASTNSWELSVHHPAERWKDGLYLAIWHGDCQDMDCFGRGDGEPVTLAYRIEYYRYQDWPWLKASVAMVDVPPGSSAAVDLRMAVPMDAAPGQYGGALLVDYDRSADDIALAAGGGYELPERRLVIPVSVNVPAQLKDRAVTLAGGGPADTPYDNGGMRGLLDRTWREETGDWRPFYVQAGEGSPSAMPDGSHWVARTIWSDPLDQASDIDTLLFAPAADAFTDAGLPDERGQLADPAWFGPFGMREIGASADALVGNGTWAFNTSSEGNEDWVSGPTSRGGLVGVLAHNVRFGGSDYRLPFTTTLSSLGVTPWPLRLSATGCADVVVRSQVALPDLAAITLGLTSPNVEKALALANDRTVERILHLTTPGAGFSAIITGELGTDIDLSLLYDADGDGRFDDLEQIAISDSPTEHEAIRLAGLAKAGDYLVRITPFSVSAVGTHFDLYINYVAGEDLILKTKPKDVAVGQPATFQVCAKPVFQNRPLAGALVFGPAAAPGLVTVPIQWTSEPSAPTPTLPGPTPTAVGPVPTMPSSTATPNSTTGPVIFLPSLTDRWP